jgi:hypothetical protein
MFFCCCLFPSLSSACPSKLNLFFNDLALLVVELCHITSQIIDEVELTEEDVVEDETNSGVDDDDDDDDDELLVPKSPTPVQDEFCSFDDTDDNTDFEDVESGAGGGGGVGGGSLGVGGSGGGGMKKVFASILDVESQEDEDDDQPPSLPPSLPPVLIVTDDADVVASSATGTTCPSPQPSIISRPMSTTGVVLHSLVYAPRPYSAPKNINPF